MHVNNFMILIQIEKTIWIVVLNWSWSSMMVSVHLSLFFCIFHLIQGHNFKVMLIIFISSYKSYSKFVSCVSGCKFIQNLYWYYFEYSWDQKTEKIPLLTIQSHKREQPLSNVAHSYVQSNLETFYVIYTSSPTQILTFFFIIYLVIWCFCK